MADPGLIPVLTTTYTDRTTDETTSLLNDFVMLFHILATGWAALDYIGFNARDTVSLFGAGPVGLLAAYSALPRDGSRVYSVEYISDRLAVAQSMGAIPISFQTLIQLSRSSPRGQKA